MVKIEIETLYHRSMNILLARSRFDINIHLSCTFFEGLKILRTDVKTTSEQKRRNVCLVSARPKFTKS